MKNVPPILVSLWIKLCPSDILNHVTTLIQSGAIVTEMERDTPSEQKEKHENTHSHPRLSEVLTWEIIMELTCKVNNISYDAPDYRSKLFKLATDLSEIIIDESRFKHFVHRYNVHTSLFEVNRQEREERAKKKQSKE